MPHPPDVYARLPHAYGPAKDTPEQLRRLLDGDEGERTAAEKHLYSALLHQGTLFPAAAPAMHDLIEALRERPDHPAARIIAEFVGEVATSVGQTGLRWDALRAGVPADAEEHLALLAMDEDEEGDEPDWETHGDLAFYWVALECAEQFPEAVLALVPLQQSSDEELWNAAETVLEEIEKAEAALGPR